MPISEPNPQKKPVEIELPGGRKAKLTPAEAKAHEEFLKRTRDIEGNAKAKKLIENLAKPPEEDDREQRAA